MIYISKNTPLPPFLPLPKFLFHSPLSLNARLLYGLMLNRSLLSRQNAWTDDAGHVYIIYPIGQMAGDLDCSDRTVKKLLNELEQNGLLQRVHAGVGKANYLFVLLPDAFCPDGKNTTYAVGTFFPGQGKKPAPDRGKYFPSEGKNPVQSRGKKFPPSNTKREYNNLSKTEREKEALSAFGCYQNVLLTKDQREALQKDFPDRLDRYVEKLSFYLQQTGKRYDCHEAVLRRWMLEDGGQPEREEEGTYL